MAQTAWVAEMVGSAIDLGTQGGYTKVPPTPNLPYQKSLFFKNPELTFQVTQDIFHNPLTEMAGQLG